MLIEFLYINIQVLNSGQSRPRLTELDHSKSHLIVKQQHLTNAKELFADTEVQITTEGQRHLGAIIGSV